MARTVTWLAAVLLLTAAGAAGCGDDSGGAAEAPSRTPKPATSSADPAAAKKEVAENWRKFFDRKVPSKEKVGLLENGPEMSPVLKSFNGDQRGQQVEAKVTRVVFTSATEADVTYDLTLKGATALPDAKGTAVYQDKVWKVSDKTLCALVKLSGNASAKGC